MPEVPWRTIWSCHLTEEIAPDKRTPESGDFVADSHGHFGRIYTPTGVMGVEPHFWRMRGLLVTDPEKKYYPRAMISVAHDCNPDENRDNTVIRGEIISAVNVMQWRVRLSIFEHEEIFPVCLLFSEPFIIMRPQIPHKRLGTNHQE
ncbi:uncharacterized protein BDCG_17051 [Blastomyces dermatitidis ER-3]|uniref:Uncharacterized protein n=2 Tax=Ajellomyces dermatitidis TaxID=5039 RepID=A0A0J9EMT2_AJEDA|nr:uncharacterized protein BDCG_17051 [Blastomyces dermatitidis ER-3]EQL37858.1 hypothetical protein BDFG_00892 [Blastomyces dermatitidis ATCC 26199]KMW67406.1 hypothetical protein BDDG_12106 [Blastomyces dermatitidis ATCC 18188]OAT01360.1 hypothetical protein BDCG_17051 [Blastomyces dermatitidis ER-3]